MTFKISAQLVTSIEAEYDVESEEEAFRRFRTFYPDAAVFAVNDRPYQPDRLLECCSPPNKPACG